MKLCISCGNEIHPKRLEILPNATKCVSCSTTNKKAGVTVTKGTGDHTYNDIVIMDHEDYLKYQEMENKTYKKQIEETPNQDDVDDEDVDEIEPI